MTIPIMTDKEAAHNICKKLSKDYGVDCEDKTLSSCFRQIAKEVHPDKHPGEEERYTTIFNGLNGIYDQCGDYKNTPCNNVTEPIQIPRPIPTPIPRHRPPYNDPYREAYEKTTSEVPKGAPFQDFKTRFIANLIPLVTKTSLALVAFGIVYVKLTGNSRSVPPGLNFGRGGGTKKRKTLSGGGGPSRQSKITNLPNTNSRRLAAANNKYFSNRGTTPIINASSRLNSARGDYYNDFKITEGRIPGAKSESGVGLADMEFDLPPQANRHTRNRVTRGSMGVSQPLAAMLLVSLMLIPAVSAQNVEALASLGDQPTALASLEDQPTMIAPFSNKSNALAAMQTMESSQSMYQRAVSFVTGEGETKLAQFCNMHGVPVDRCSKYEINKQVTQFKDNVAQLPGVFNSLFSKLVNPVHQTSQCTRFGKPDGVAEKKVVTEQGSLFYKEKSYMVLEQQFKPCAYPAEDVVSLTYDADGNPVLHVNAEKLFHNMKELKSLSPKFCPNIQVVVPKYQRVSNLQTFMQQLFEHFTLDQLKNIDAAATYNQCIVTRITEDISDTVFQLLHKQHNSKKDITSAAFSELFNLLDVAVNPNVFLYNGEEQIKKFNEDAMEAALSKTWAGMAKNAAKEVGEIAGSTLAGSIYGLFEPFYNMRTINVMGSMILASLVVSICARLLNPVAILTSKLPSLPALPSSFNPFATPVNNPLALHPPANPPLAIQSANPPANPPLAIQGPQGAGRRNRRSKRNSHKNAAHKKRKGTSSRYRSHKHK